VALGGAVTRAFVAGPGRFLLLSLALVPLFVRRCWSADWIGDFWIYVASIGEIAHHPLSPANALYGTSYAFAFYSPYIWVLGLVSRLTGIGAFDVLVIQGLVNLGLLLGALYLFVVTWVKRPAAAFYAVVMMLLLWGSDPWIFSSVFNLRSLTYVLPYPSTFAAALALGTLALFPRLSRDGSLRWVGIVAPVSLVLWTVHPVNALFLWTGLFVASLDPVRPPRHFVVLALTALATFGFAMAWPLYPVRELWFHQTEMVHGGNDEVYKDSLRCILPALLGLPWLVVRLWRNKRDKVALLAVALVLFWVYGGLSGKWSYGRLISHAVLMLQLSVADALAALEDRLRLRNVSRGLLAFAVVGVLLWRAWPTAVEPTLRRLSHGDRAWLSFLSSHVKRSDVVLTDIESCWFVPSFSGKVVAFPMRIPFVPDHDARVEAVERFFMPETTREERLATIARYQVGFVLVDKAHVPNWRELLAAVAPFVSVEYSQGDYELLGVKQEGRH
jgi:hypothetical protein